MAKSKRPSSEHGTFCVHFPPSSSPTLRRFDRELHDGTDLGPYIASVTESPSTVYQETTTLPASGAASSSLPISADVVNASDPGHHGVLMQAATVNGENNAVRTGERGGAIPAGEINAEIVIDTVAVAPGISMGQDSNTATAAQLNHNKNMHDPPPLLKLSAIPPEQMSIMSSAAHEKLGTSSLKLFQ